MNMKLFAIPEPPPILYNRKCHYLGSFPVLESEIAVHIKTFIRDSLEIPM